MIQKKFYLINLMFLLIGFSSFGQSFKLKDPSIEQLRTLYLNDKNENDIVYLYLIQNYKPTSKKQNIRRSNYNHTKVCSFDQNFENGIHYSTDACTESGGINIVLELPKISKENIKSWVEKIYKADPTEIKNEWYKDQNTYGPIGGESGCYYKMSLEKEKWIIEIYCGC